MRLIIVRHGETVGNIKGIIQGHLPGKLSKKGKVQAKKVARRLKNEKIDHIYSSDLKRAEDTAKEIAKYHKGVPLELTKELRELYYGAFEGKRRDVVGYGKLPKNGETSEQAIRRARHFLDTILHKHKKDTVLFVTHGTIGKAIITVIKNRRIRKRWSKKWWLHNTSVSIFKIYEDRRHRIHLFNDVKHLGRREAQHLKKKYAFK